MFGGEKLKAVFRLGEDLADELTQPLVEAIALRAAGFGKHEPAVIDVVAESPTSVGTEFEVGFARDPEHGRLLEVILAGRWRVEHVPGEPGRIVLLPARFDVVDQMGDVVAVAVPVGRRVMAAFGHDHGPPALGEEQQREARGHDRVLDPVGNELS